MAKQLEDQIRNALQVTDFQLRNQSKSHAGHSGVDDSGETHFKIMVVSPDFDGLGRLQRQKKVMDCVKPLFEQGLHALSIKALAPEEAMNKK
jgi:BolA protein